MSLFDQIEICRHALTEIERIRGEEIDRMCELETRGYNMEYFLNLIQPDIEWQEAHSTSKQMKAKVEAFRQLRPKE